MLRRGVLLCLSIAWSAWARTAGAQAPAVVLTLEGEEQRELAERLAWELRSEGFEVELRAPAPLPCDDPRGSRAAWPGRTQIALRRTANRGDGVLVVLCHESAAGDLRRASLEGALERPEDLAVSTAEALNGLRARLPPDTVRAAPAPQMPRASAPEPRAAPPRRGQLWVGMTLASEVTELPAVEGVELGLGLDVVPRLALALETFWPVREAMLDAAGGTASLRLAWARLGPRARLRAGQFDLSAAFMLGPALAWTSGDVAAPRVGVTDVGAAAMLTLRGALEFPSTTPVYAFAAGGYSQLLPRFRIATDRGSAPELGQVLLEGSVGLGLRWPKAHQRTD